MQIPKIKIPKVGIKVKVKLSSVFLLILGIAVAAELAVMYKYFAVSKRPAAETPVAEEETVRINMKAFQKAADWVKQGRSYELPGYSLRQGSTGRDNPFAEY